MHEIILCISNGEFPQAIRDRPMEIWYSVQENNFLFLVIYLQIGIGNDALTNLIDFFSSDVEKLSTVE